MKLTKSRNLKIFSGKKIDHKYLRQKPHKQQLEINKLRQNQFSLSTILNSSHLESFYWYSGMILSTHSSPMSHSYTH